MKVVERGVVKDGTAIQLEDWTEHNTEEYPNLYGFTVAAYPVAQRTGRYKWVLNNTKFRLGISSNAHQNYSNDDVKADYEALKAGTKVLEDLAAHFGNGEKDMWYLGMNVQEPNWELS